MIKVESESIANIETIKQEIEADRLDNSDKLDKEEINPYYKIITNKVEGENTITSQIKQWSILSNIKNYEQYNRHPEIFYDLHIETVVQKSHKKIHDKEEERHILDLDFGNTP